MTEIQAIPLVDLVHIRPGFPGESERIDELLEATGLRVAVFTDVYRGLARLARLAQDGEARSLLRAVLVQVDDLGPPEMEFFSITSRVLARTPVLVYGSDRLQSRVELALERGATDRASPEIITRLAAHGAASTNDDTADRDAPAPMPMAQPGQPGVDLESDAATEPVAFPEVVRDDPPPRTDQPENETTAPTRVPWLDYENRPVRQAPRHSAPQPTSAVEPKEDDQPEEASARKRPSATEPLLTEEELRALMGDDISSIAPSEAEPNEIAGPAEERGDA
ncbi:MAG: hypothetical protein IIC02_10765 [Planctomycetes bacterium]|nr:hypothetical protein [Planctomycetota bacterium]